MFSFRELYDFVSTTTIPSMVSRDPYHPSPRYEETHGGPGITLSINKLFIIEEALKRH